MKDIRLHAIHMRLTRIFTGVVFFVVLIIGTSLITTTHISENRYQGKFFIKETDRIIKSIQAKNDYLKNFFPSEQNRLLPGKNFKDINNDRGPNRISFFVLDKDNTVIFQNILENPGFENIEFSDNELIQRDNFLLLKTPLGEGSLVFYKSKNLLLVDFLQDMLLLISLSVLFSGLMYYIGYKFVHKALVPVEENIEDMKHFIHNASHELKTPLSVMRGNLQIIQAEKKYDESLILSSIENVDKMNGLIEGLRELSEVGKLKQQEFLALTTIVDDVIGQYKDNIEKKSLLLITQLNSNYSLRANKQELSMLIANILGNAIKYSQEKGEINVGVKKNILEISDHGPGMTKIEQEKVFDRFYQGSTGRNAEGFGIGLSLVRKIADSNNWKIELDSEEKKGTTFRILF